MTRFFREILSQVSQYKYFLLNFVRFELKVRYKHTFLGGVWVVVSPLLYFLILGFVFSFVIRGGLENYKLFFISGMVPWMMLNNTIMTQVSSLENNGELMKRIAVPKLIFPLSSNIARQVDNLIFVVILIILYLLSGAGAHWYHLWLIPIWLLFFMTTLGIGMILAIVNVFIRDTAVLSAIVFQILFFMSPIIYSLDLIPKKFIPIFVLNPFYYFIEVFHYLFYYQLEPRMAHLLAMSLVAVASMGLALFLYRFTEKKIVYYLSY